MWSRIGVCLCLVAGAVAGVPPEPAGAAPPVLTPLERTVTLVTGDRFVVAEDGASVVKVPTPGREGVHYLTRRYQGRLEVIPDDALGPLGDGKLDPRLFDVTTLLEDGYDDAHGGVPLIVEHADGELATEATGRWGTLTASPEVAKVWLDGKRELLLDESVALVGAPEAWASGLTGEGVAVGVIDSGVDASHPDLAGRVEARDFTGTGLADATGHATHVASIIAGSGAASGGRYRGVAPGATIYSGKVCPDRSCSESAMLEAMTWMAAELRLKVVNMSIGGTDSAGDDPLEAAVETLTRDYGTLFVVSAGNSGASEPVSSPASAASALAVAATNKDDTMADYSSGGPRVDGGVLKPDLAAPGTDITAAAAPALFSDTGYATLSGTSMAAPHVAGAAAILAQQHPGWTAGRLKAALTASAAAVAGELNPYRTGAGRLDVARAAKQTVTTSPAGVQVEGETVTTRTVTYRNDGAEAVTLGLSLDGRTTLGAPAPEGMFRLGASTVTVPAGGEATVDVTVDPGTTTRPDAYGGVLVATGGGVSVRSPVGLDRQPTVTLTLSHLDRTGAATSRARVVVAGLDNRFVYSTTELRTGTLALSVPAGRYLVSSTIMTPATPYRTVTMLTDPQLDLAADTSLVMDARRGRPVSITTDRADAVQPSGLLNVAATVGAGELLAFGIGGPFDAVFSARLGTGEAPHAETRISAGFAAPGDDGIGTNSPWTLSATLVEPGVPDGWTGTVATAGAAKVTQHLASAVDGSTADLFTIPVWADHGRDEFAFALEHALPGDRTDYFVSAPGVTWETQFWHNAIGMSDFTPDLPTYANSWTAAPVAYRSGKSYAQSWNRGVFGPAFPAKGTPLVRDGDRITGVPNLYSDDRGRYGSAITTAVSVQLTRDGEPVTSQTYLALNATVPEAAATYRLSVATQRREAVGLSTSNAVTWTFASARTPAAEPLPLSVLRFHPVVDEHNTVTGERFYTLGFTAQAQPGSAAAPIATVTVELSYDGGTTWVRPHVTHVHGTGAAVVPRPSGTGTVSIRSTATDRAGAVVEQEITDAFRY